jgi:hypothetical protein
MVENLYMKCGECNRVFKLGKSVKAYTTKYPKSIYCPFCGQDNTFSISMNQYHQEKDIQFDENLKEVK